MAISCSVVAGKKLVFFHRQKSRRCALGDGASHIIDSHSLESLALRLDVAGSSLRLRLEQQQGKIQTVSTSTTDFNSIALFYTKPRFFTKIFYKLM